MSLPRSLAGSSEVRTGAGPLKHNSTLEKLRNTITETAQAAPHHITWSIDAKAAHINCQTVQDRAFVKVHARNVRSLSPRCAGKLYWIKGQ